MPQIDILVLLKSTSLTLKDLRKELIYTLAKKWPSEYKRLCQPMKCSPSVLHELVNLAENDLPSSILLENNLLLNEKGNTQTKQNYDRKSYVELNRAISSVLALFYILRGDCFEELVEGQKKEITLSLKSYLELHQQFKELFFVKEIWNEPLLETMFYAVLFNDLGKNIELKNILHDKYQLKETDHDLILRNAFQIEGLLEDFGRLNSSQQRCLRALWHSGFNPSSFDTLEYPLSIIVNWVISFTKIAKENTQLYLAMKKIEILTDIAGVNGNNSRGAINLTEPVVAKFNVSFELLHQLCGVYNQELYAEEKDDGLIYKAILKKLEEQLLTQAKNLDLSLRSGQLQESILILRLCKMLGIREHKQTATIVSVLKRIKQQNPEHYKCLEQEFFWTQALTKPLLWMQCIPKFLWLMSNGTNYDLLAENTLKNSIERRENGLYSGLIILSNILKKIRNDDKYGELYTFVNNDLVKVSSTKGNSKSPYIALFVAYDLIVVAQQASELNSNIQLRQKAIHELKSLWIHGALIKERFITIPQISVTKACLTNHSFFDNYQVAIELVTKQQQELLERLSEETRLHCAYLSSIGLADRASYFKVRPFVYQDLISKMVDISRFKCKMVLPTVITDFDIHEKNTLFAYSESSREEEHAELKSVLDIRLYPTIRQLIEKNGAHVFLGFKTELQVYTESIKEKLILEIEVPSSVKFYIALNNVGDIKIYISDLVSHENLIQQLSTLKLAGIDLQKIPILGDTKYYNVVCRKDLSTFETQATAYLAKKNILIIAGCSLEDTVCSTLEQIFLSKISQQKFSGSIVSLTYIKSQHAPNLGFIILNLNYGEICEEQISIILEKFNCIGIFSGSAAGCIPKETQDKLPEIGDRILVNCSKHYSGELAIINETPSNLHLHVPTIFFETFNWLKNAKELGASSVDVETFYILRAVQKYQKANPHKKLHTDIGVFISDYVGKKPLRSYHNVFAKYPLILQNFIDSVLVANITARHDNNRTSIPIFSSQYFGLKPEKITITQPMRREAVVDSIGKLWDKEEFSKRVHTPVTIGLVKNQKSFVKSTPRCIHLPIKLPGSDIRIPAEYQHFAEELQQIFNFEVSINSDWNKLYAYLTVDQGFVPRSYSQRVPGPHVDGIPRDRENPEKQLIDHAYLVTNAIPTMFYTQQFDMSRYDPKIHHFFAIFRALSDESRTITVKPFEIVLMNAYSVHTPTQTLEDVTRTFMRLEFSTLQFDRIGNSINPHFLHDEKYKDYPFNYIPRPIPKHLFVPPEVYLDKPITNEDYSNESLDKFGRANLRSFFIQNDRYKLKLSDYKDLNILKTEIMNEKNNGIVLLHQGIPHAFCLYKIENKKIKLDTLYTFMNGRGQEMMIYALKILQHSADKLSIQCGEKEVTPITIIVNENNDKMLPYFLRAARLAKIEVNIERLGRLVVPNLSTDDSLSQEFRTLPRI